jgi:hypothetical protein
MFTVFAENPLPGVSIRVRSSQLGRAWMNGWMWMGLVKTTDGCADQLDGPKARP